MRFRIDLKIFIFLVLFYFTKQIEIYSTIMIFCIIHELGHLLSGILLGMKLTKIEIMPFGLSVSFKLHIKDYNKKIIKANLLEVKKIVVAVSGPVMNLFVILLINIFDISIIEKNIAIYSNFLILMFNLLPIYPLDGGRMLKSIIHIFCGGKNAKIITNRIANYMMITITVIGSIGIFYFENIAIFLIIIFLWGIVIHENRRYSFVINAYNSFFSNL